MGYLLGIASAPGGDSWSVLLRVNLSRAESNELFLSGDSMVWWPVEGLRPPTAESGRPERSGMFVSEIAAQPVGLKIDYEEQARAEHAVTLLRMQFAQIGIEEEK